jgi:pectinesterase inhibitor-like protein
MAACRTARTVNLLTLSISVLFSANLLVAVAAAPKSDSSVKEACAKSPDPTFCAAFLSGIPESGTADARGLAELAIRAAAKIGAELGTAARTQLNVVTVKGAQWQCMDSCVADVEEAVSHLDVDRGKATTAMEDAKFNDARDYIEAGEKDGLAWNCDLCREGLPAPVKTGLLPKGNEFEKVMGVTGALIKRAVGSAAPAPAPAPSSTRRREI